MLPEVPFDAAAGLEGAGLLSGVDDSYTDAVLDGVGGVVEFQLDCDVAGQVSVHAVEADDGSAADNLGDIVVHL